MKLTDNNDMHKISDKFENASDQTIRPLVRQFVTSYRMYHILGTMYAGVLKFHMCLFDLGLTSLSTFFSHIATVSGCGRELNAHF